jgi:hypothetical protein
VPKYARDRRYILTSAKKSRRGSMAQVMKTGALRQLGGVTNWRPHASVKIAATKGGSLRVPKKKTPWVGRGTDATFKPCERRHREGTQRHRTLTSPRFNWCKVSFPCTTLFGELAADGNHALAKVYIAPPQAKGLAYSQTVERRKHEHGFVGISLCGLEQSPNVLTVEGDARVLFRSLRRLHLRGRIVEEGVFPLCSPEGGAQESERPLPRPQPDPAARQFVEPSAYVVGPQGVDRLSGKRASHHASVE